MDKYWKLKVDLPNAENQKVINEYLLSLKIANKSFYTINNFRYFYQNFFKDQDASFTVFTSNDIQKWFSIHDKEFKKNTVRFHLSALSAFYNFCIDEGYLERSPIKMRWFPRCPISEPKYLDKEEMAKVRRQAESLFPRDYAIMEFLIATGCRVGEVCRLDKKDVDFESRTACVLGKGKKIRQVHFTDKCSILLERYLESRNDDHPALFVSYRGRLTRLSTSWIGKILNELGKRSKLSASLHPHRLRHTFATDLLAKGADLVFIAEELGHSDVKTTQIYARLPKREIISHYRKYMG